MEELRNRRHEWFAILRAEGMSLEEAYEKAGYAPDRAHACRLAARPDVARRISELRIYRGPRMAARVSDAIPWMLQVARTGLEMRTAAGLREARSAFAQAARLQARLERAMAHDRALIEKELAGLTPRGRRRGPPAELAAPVDPALEPVDQYRQDDPPFFDPFPEPPPPPPKPAPHFPKDPVYRAWLKGHGAESGPDFDPFADPACNPGRVPRSESERALGPTPTYETEDAMEYQPGYGPEESPDAADPHP